MGSLWIDGAWYVVTGPGTQKGRNLAHDPACTLTARLEGIDLVFSGRAHRVTDPTELQHVADVYRRQGWPAEVAGDAFTAPFTAPSGGPPPWHLYRIAAGSVVGVGSGAGVPARRSGRSPPPSADVGRHVARWSGNVRTGAVGTGR